MIFPSSVYFIHPMFQKLLILGNTTYIAVPQAINIKILNDQIKVGGGIIKEIYQIKFTFTIMHQ